MKTFCSYYNQKICSSCNRIEDSYDQQLQIKSDKLAALLGSKDRYQTLPAVASKTTSFRNKAKFSVTGSLDRPIIGLTGEEELDLGREINNCPLHHPVINEMIQTLPTFIQMAKLIPYQIKSQTGELKGVIVYYSSESNEMFLRLILRSKESLDRLRKYKDELLKLHPSLSCFSANIQPIAHAILEGDEEIYFTDKHFIRHKISTIAMTLDPQGFVQTNQEMAVRLYSTAAQWVKELSPTTFVELFSGQGAFSFFMAPMVNRAIGIEINSQAVERANQTAQLNNWPHLTFIAQDAANMESQVANLKPDVLLVNPPRRGLGATIEVIKKLKSPYFIYSSCQAETLAQDISKLKDIYQIKKVQIFDMFPHTDHFETLVLLQLI
jgi:23S rRNA (uracil747-C5)-methyltransferase